MIRKLAVSVVLLPMFGFGQDGIALLRPAFEVASVRPSSASKNKRTSYVRYTSQGVEAASFDLHTLISEAYQIPVARIPIPDSRVHKILDDSYDVVAKAERPVSKDQLRLMLQTLFADRFKLSVHREFRQQGVYRLVVGKRGPRLPEPVAGGGTPRVARELEGLGFYNVTMAQFCERLSLNMDRPVLDATGILGAYTFRLKIDGLPNPKRSGPSGDDLSTSSIFTDLPQQVGLQLAGDKASMEYLIVDHVELPSEN